MATRSAASRTLFSRLATILLVGLLSLLGLTVVGAGSAYGSAPVVKSLSPTAGSADGGATVTITGSGLASATAVTFGGVPATSFVDVSGTKVTAVVPPAANGTASVEVVVTVGGVQSTPQAAGDDIFTYTWLNPPTVTGTGLVGATATQSGNTVTVTATGTWTAGQLVSVSGFSNKLPSAIYSVVTGGTNSFTITNLGSTSGAGSGTVSPTAAGAVGPIAGGSTVVIVGTHLAGASSVDFGTTPATSVTVNSGTQLTAVVPPGTSGSVDITVTTPNSTTPTSVSDTFNYVGPPVVSGVTTTATPAGGPTGGGTQVTMAGSGYNNVSAVTFGTTPATSLPRQLAQLDHRRGPGRNGHGRHDRHHRRCHVTDLVGRPVHLQRHPGCRHRQRRLLQLTGHHRSRDRHQPVRHHGDDHRRRCLDSRPARHPVRVHQRSDRRHLHGPRAGTGSFTITFAPTLSGSGTGSALVLTALTPSAVTATSQTGSSVTLTAVGTWFQGQQVYLTGFTNGLTTGNYTVTSGTSGSFTVNFPGTTTGTAPELPSPIRPRASTRQPW